MIALAKAESWNLARGGWLPALFALEAILFGGAWLSGSIPDSAAFDRRIAQADMLLLLLASLPALFAAALSASSDREDGMAELWASHRIGPLRYVGGKWLGITAMLWLANLGAMGLGAAVSLIAGGQALRSHLATFSSSCAFALAGSAIFAAWGLLLGMACRSRLAAMVAALVFWFASLFLLESLVTALLAALPPYAALPILWTTTLLNPAETIRIGLVFSRGQGAAYGPVFHQIQLFFQGPRGLATGAVILGFQAFLPLACALLLGKRRFPS